MQVRIRIRHDIDFVSEFGTVVDFAGVLEHLGVGVRDHEQGIAPAGVRRQCDGQVVGVTFAHAQRTVVQGISDDLVVLVSKNIVLREHDFVGPLAGTTGARTPIGDRVAHVNGGGVGNRARWSGDIGHGQVSVVVQHHIEDVADGRVVAQVAFAHRAGGVAVVAVCPAVGEHHQLIGA